MNPPRLLVLYVLFSPFVRQSAEARSTAPAFFPRGGGPESFRQRGRKRSPTSKEVPTGSDSDVVAESIDGDAHGNETMKDTFDREAVTKRLHKEAVAETKKAQVFLKKQQRRREMDKTWLDKGITSVIEFFENLFRWEVIDV